jgi:peroxiredoxin
MSTDAAPALSAWSKELKLHHVLLGDFRRQVLPKYDALVTDEKHPLYQRGKRAYYVVDKNGVVKFMKVMDNPLDLLEPGDLLAAVKAAGV